MSPCTKFKSIWRISGFGTKFAQKIWMRKILKKKTLNSKYGYSNVPQQQKFGTGVHWYILILRTMSIQFGELQFLGRNLPKKTL